MSNPVNLDVMVVYSSAIALSASVNDAESIHPFLISSRRANYNLSYAYFLDTCHEYGLKAGFTTSKDIIGPGLCRNYWTQKAGKWTKRSSKAQSKQIFDKISPSTPLRLNERKMLLSNKSIKPFNDLQLFQIFYDKLLTYKSLPTYGIPTIAISITNPKAIELSLRKLVILIKRHPYKDDFSKQIVLKDRFGAGGNYVYKIENDFINQILAKMVKFPRVHFVIQPFLEFEKGFSYKANESATDIRLIYHHNRLLQCYVRVAKPSDFRCNEHQGGQLIYVNKADIPRSVYEMSESIVTKIDKPNSVYALDFVISNTGRVYFLEGNIGPGIDWDTSKVINENKSKQLIRSIVKEFSTRINKSLLA